MEKAKCLDCGNINEVKVSTGHKNPENKGKKYFECVNCKRYHWDSDVKTSETTNGEQVSTSNVTKEPVQQGFNGFDQRSFRIERQHSQEMSLRFLDLLIKTGQLKEVTKDLVKGYTDLFQKDLSTKLDEV